MQDSKVKKWTGFSGRGSWSGGSFCVRMCLWNLLVLFFWIGFGFGGVLTVEGAAVDVSSNSNQNQKGAKSFTPSISELSVPFRDNPKIILGNFPGNSVVLPLLNGEVSASNYLVHLARQAGNSDPGFFIVEAPKNYGVMAVIQQLHLRRISDTKSLLQLVNNCKDYIVFEGHNGEKTIPICGTLEKGDNSFYPTNLHGPKFFNSPNGRIKVTFRNHYSYGNDIVSQNDQSDEQQNQEMLMVEIAFTAYSNCTTAAEMKDKFQCTLEKCIDSSLACDTTVNCAPGENQSHMGVDEVNCTRRITNLSEIKPRIASSSTPLGRGRPQNHQNNEPHHLHSQPSSPSSVSQKNPSPNPSSRPTTTYQGRHSSYGRRLDIERDEEDSNLSSSRVTFLDDEILEITKPRISGKTKASRNNNENKSDQESDSDDGPNDPSNNNGDSYNDNNYNDNDNSRFPNLTTIIILIIILVFITICGYFWSWVSQFVCAARGLLRSAEVGVENCTHNNSNNNNNNNDNNNGSLQASSVSTMTAAPRLPIAYYVPAMVLRTASRNSTNATLQAVSLNSDGDFEKNRKISEDSPPPSYELLFPQSQSQILPGSGHGSASEQHTMIMTETANHSTEANTTKE